MHMPFLVGSAATENTALVAAGAPNWQATGRGLFTGDASTVPVGNPTSGTFLYSNGGTLTARNRGGHVAPLVKPRDVQVFTASDTWMKGAGTVTVERHLIGGGGTGRISAAGTVRGGGRAGMN